MSQIQPWSKSEVGGSTRNHDGYVVATDVGGTFVDTVILGRDGQAYLGKTSAPEGALIASVAAAGEELGLSIEDVLGNTALFVNGTTVATNAMIERSGAVVGLITTAGFEDTLIIGRVKARTAGLNEVEVMNYQTAVRPDPFASVSLTRGIKERIDYRGEVLLDLDDDEAVGHLDDLVARGMNSLAVALLWSFRNPVHEQRIRALARDHYPDLYITLSSDLAPVIREYERTNTTVVNSYLGPVVSGYVEDLQTSLSQSGYDRGIMIMQSVGGLAPAARIKSTPVTLLQSGPVGGIIAAERLGRWIGEPNIIAADMGGTSFDVGLVVDGVPQTNPSPVVERNILLVPAVDVASIGAGGGSIAWLDELNTLHVGPQSAGANPGPACYGRGGTLPTVTDADVVLGYISPTYFAGGDMELDPELSARAIKTKIADPLGMSVDEAAEGIYRIINAHMADLIRKVTVERGFDPRDFILLNYGGCGPTHCTGYGPDLGVRSLLIPNAASVFSALGIAQSDLRYYFSRSLDPMTMVTDQHLTDDRLEMINRHFGEMRREAGNALDAGGFKTSDRLVIRHLDLRYKGQTNELTIPLRTSQGFDLGGVADLVSDFVRKYEMLYGGGSHSTMAPIEVITARLDVVIPAPLTYSLNPSDPEGPDASGAVADERDVYWRELDGYTLTPVYRGSRLRPGNKVHGPALIESFGTTIPVRPGQELELDRFHNYAIRV